MERALLVPFWTNNYLGIQLNKMKMPEIFNFWVGLLDMENLGNHGQIDFGYKMWIILSIVFLKLHEHGQGAEGPFGIEVPLLLQCNQQGRGHGVRGRQKSAAPGILDR